ncbi:uncharacterized protein LTR77_008322 [Saxophila tyrrhenica]|uniref:ubiquitinyl hydrolase 1 n=1 Tax=Saxophila tyrrhenica TaxID=1690608 RepID=A0AAV9P1F5_9PEZI|nr:hypothetical protein LTR77_008322 [Saxophila tyrrhenica]
MFAPFTRARLRVLCQKRSKPSHSPPAHDEQREPLSKRRSCSVAWSSVGTLLAAVNGAPLYLIPIPERKPHQPDHFEGVFTPPHHDPPKKTDKEEEKKVKAIIERLRHYGIDSIVEANVEYALHSQSPQGDPEAAFRMLMMLEDTYEGIIRPYDPNVKLLGAVNRGATTCYLDALLFAMFARLDSFEAILYENFEDAKRKRLAGLLRLWVNMLRTGRLITVDITAHLQHALVECGWADAGLHRQQDPSEAFGFITGQLELPMLTLKMDMYHTGKEDPTDDHKFINERLLEVALLDEPAEGRDVITLEDCLEHYFNNRIEVKRHMESQRRNTLKSANFAENPTKVEKESGAHVEVLEIPGTPIAQSPNPLTPLPETPLHQTKVEQLRPSLARKRADSIFSQRKVELTGIDPEDLKRHDTNTSVDTRGRKLSTRTEVLMPAWQFFKLLPWYTDHMPTSDAQVAAHFSKKRPVLGICLKRYSYTNEGQARRRDTYVDIPLEIAVPDFVSDDAMPDQDPLVGNFRLMLQSVVCHRGVSVHSGHYVCLARGRVGTGLATQSSADERRNSNASEDNDDPWMRFDDLAPERTTPVDIHEALRQETPYLLFYQVVPISDDGHSIHDLPSYTEATSRSQSDATTLEKPFAFQANESAHHLEQVKSEPTSVVHASTDVLDFTSTSERTSLDASTMLDDPRGRSEASGRGEGRHQSITFDTSSVSGSISTATDAATNSVPTTPSEEKSNSFLAVANKLSNSRRGSRNSKASGSAKSRPTSTGPDTSGNRFSLNMSKLTQIMSNNTGSHSSKGEGSSAEEPPLQAPSEHGSTDLGGPKDTIDGASEASHPVPSATEPAPSIPKTDSNASKENVSIPATRPVKPTVAIPAPAPAPAKSKKEKEREKHAAKHAHAHGKAGKKGEDRDCVVM